MSEVRECPFCGSKEVYPQYNKTNGFVRNWYECLSCHARTGPYSTEEEALKAWNERIEEYDYGSGLR